MTNPIYDPYQVLTRVYSDGTLLKQALAETPVEPLNQALTTKIVYGVLENDGYLSYCIAQNTEKNPKQAIRTLLKVSLYLLIYLKKPRYMVTDNAVALCKKLGKGGASGFANAFLRRFDESKLVLPAGDAGLAIRTSFPPFAVRKIRAQYGDRTEAILSARSVGVTVRFVGGEEEYLDREHLDTPFSHTYIFPHFVRDENFFSGKYTFQSVGSIAICDVVESCRSLLDACAAPGGKSVLLSEKCAQVTSFELHEHRVRLIEQYAARMHRENVLPVRQDSSVFRADLEEKFDGVLCDVPCSGFGTVSENPDVKLHKTEEQISELNRVQCAILSTCASYVALGGYLYYSTCSIFREENDGIVGKFLREHPEYEIQKIGSPLSHIDTEYGLQFLPDTAFGAGFYIAKLKRVWKRQT